MSDSVSTREESEAREVVLQSKSQERRERLKREIAELESGGLWTELDLQRHQALLDRLKRRRKRSGPDCPDSLAVAAVTVEGSVTAAEIVTQAIYRAAVDASSIEDALAAHANGNCGCVESGYWF